MENNQADVFAIPKHHSIDTSVFKSLQATDRMKVINHIVNVNGLRTPRNKSWKNMDSENYGRTIHGRMHAIVFEITVNKLNKL